MSAETKTKALDKLSKFIDKDIDILKIDAEGAEVEIIKELDEADEEGLEAMDSLKVDVESLPDGLELRLLKIV
jgi:hypothetical protein